MRGGNFWQGAAAGLVSSLAGSAAQGVGIHGWGMVGISAASGGVGAWIAGGKAEDILFGILQGAMVGALNHLQNEKLLDSKIVILEDSEGAKNNGHMAIAGGNDKKGWWLVSKYAKTDQDGNMIEGNFVSGNKSSQVKTPYKTFNELMKANTEYDKYISFSTTYGNSQRAINASYFESISDYHAMFANCGHAVSAGLNASGIYSGNSIFPESRFQQIMSFYHIKY